MISFAVGESKVLKVTFKDAAENTTPLTGAVAWSEEHGMFDPLAIQLAPISGEPDKVAATAIAVGVGKIKAAMPTPPSGVVGAEVQYTVVPGPPTHGVITVV